MSDLPNGNPPGQNNLNAQTERYVPLANDASAGAQKPDELRPPEDGIEPRDTPDPEVLKELREASKNFVEPSTAEEEGEKPPPGTEPPPLGGEGAKRDDSKRGDEPKRGEDDKPAHKPAPGPQPRR